MILLPLPEKFVETSSPVFPLDPAVEQTIEEVWQAELRVQPSLFNGHVFSVQQASDRVVSGRFVEYRHFLAQWRRPELFEQLNIEVLAVTGVLVARGGIVWGRRSAQSTQYPGTWELVPSGGVDDGARGEGGQLDLRHQILRELKEEVGIEEQALRQVRPFCFVHDQQRHLYEWGIELQASLSMDEISALRSTRARPEHSDFALVEPSRMETFIAAQPRPLSDLTRLILSARK
jgi:ADP-ribose pyrophosphatase YjhB (NUDIX family)